MALSSDMTFWINTVIFNRLADICPLLSLNGEDRKVYDICTKDFKDYLTYLETNHIKLQEDEVPTTADEILNEFLSIATGLAQNLKDTREMEEFIVMWVSMWFKKWQYRTKVVFNDMPNKIEMDSQLSLVDFTREEQEGIQRAMIDKLIQYGEICCASIIADGLFKKQIQDNKGRKWTVQDKINLIPTLQRKAKEISYTHGPLVFIKATKEYLRLREWRDDSNVSKII